MFSLKTVLLRSAKAFQLTVRGSAVQPLQQNRWFNSYAKLCAKEKKANKDDDEPKAEQKPFEVHPGYLKFKAKQQEYQVNDGNPIWLKRPFDQFLVGITWILLFIAVGIQMKMVYDLGGFAKKDE